MGSFMSSSRYFDLVVVIYLVGVGTGVGGGIGVGSSEEVTFAPVQVLAIVSMASVLSHWSLDSVLGFWTIWDVLFVFFLFLSLLCLLCLLFEQHGERSIGLHLVVISRSRVLGVLINFDAICSGLTIQLPGPTPIIPG